MSWEDILKNQSFASIAARLKKLGGENQDIETRVEMSRSSKEVPKELEDKVIDMIKREKYTLIKDGSSEINTDFRDKYYKDYIIEYFKHINQKYSGNGETLSISKRTSPYSNMMAYPITVMKLGIFQENRQPRLIEE